MENEHRPISQMQTSAVTKSSKVHRVLGVQSVQSSMCGTFVGPNVGLHGLRPWHRTHLRTTAPDVLRKECGELTSDLHLELFDKSKGRLIQLVPPG